MGYAADIALIDGKLIHRKSKTLIIEGPTEKMSKSKKMLSSLKKFWIALVLMQQEFLWYQTRRPIASWSGLMRAYKVLKILLIA